MTLISVTQRMGSGGSEIAREVADTLGLELYDDGRLQQEAREIGMRLEDVQWLDEKAPRLFDRLLSNKPDLYMHVLETVVYEVARKNQSVVLGHGSQMLLRDFGCALHVFIHASERTRRENLVQGQGLSEKAAEKLMHKKDHEQDGFFRYAYQMSIDDPTLYDLVLNTEKISRSAAIRLISELARTPEIDSCSLTALESMEKMSLLKRIQTELAERNLDFSTLHMEMPEKGVPVIRGIVYNQEELKAIEEAVRNVPGVSELKSEISVSPASY
jgi:cytidylate kinase